MTHTKVHVSQRPKTMRVPITGAKSIVVNRIVGRLLNHTVTVDVWPGDGYQRRCKRALELIAWRLAP